jgi:SAM-dependent methyltransferase
LSAARRRELRRPRAGRADGRAVRARLLQPLPRSESPARRPVPARLRPRKRTGRQVFGNHRPHIDELTIVEPSQKLQSHWLRGLQPRDVNPFPDATLPFPDASFDLVFCLSLLHHVPKVSAQVRELAHVLSPGGHMLAHEPIVSLGDWTGPRKAGLTKRERGIPLSLLRSMLTDEGLVVEYEALCNFPITRRLPHGYDSVWSVRLDGLLSKATAWNYRYHQTSAIQNIRPTGSFFVVTKPRSPASVAAP